MQYPICESDKPSDILRAAANIIADFGWHRGSLQGDDGSVCVMGAIFAATYGEPNTIQTERRESLRASTDCFATYIQKRMKIILIATEYNDRFAKDGTQVINDLNTAANECEAS